MCVFKMESVGTVYHTAKCYLCCENLTKQGVSSILPVITGCASQLKTASIVLDLGVIIVGLNILKLKGVFCLTCCVSKSHLILG